MTTHPNPIPIDGITIVREFDAPIEQVFDAWANELRFARWHGDGEAGDAAREVVSIERPRSLVTAVGGQPDPVYLTVLLDDLAGRTRMTFHQGGGQRAADQAKAEWQERFDLLDRLLREAPLD